MGFQVFQLTDEVKIWGEIKFNPRNVGEGGGPGGKAYVYETYICLKIPDDTCTRAFITSSYTYNILKNLYLICWVFFQLLHKANALAV